VVVFIDGFPELSETFVLNEVRALERLGFPVRVEATWRAEQPNPEGEGVRANYQLEDTVKRRLASLAWLVARHPLGVVRDIAVRTRWRGQNEDVRRLWRLAPVAWRLAQGGERHMHVHFAGTAALDAMRVSRLTGVPYSVTTHGYDIWREPRNLVEKLTSARFHVAVSDYNARAVAEVAPERLHKVVMGIDPEVFRRTRPYPGGRTVLAIGRLVEKKGFTDLIAAAGLLPDVTVRIVGDGPLRGPLDAAAGPNVELLGARSPAEVRGLLEEADLLALPTVIAADGDRDAMPVVVKEALAMEVPAVGTNQVAMPEVVHPGWGRLVPPHDPDALAGAIAGLLGLPAEERAAMGRAGRAFVSEHCNVQRETARLAELIQDAGSASIQSSRAPQSDRASAAGT
jgi:glycosyltransferase involved in cell wall biosynthesis